MRSNPYTPVKQKPVATLVFEQLRDSIFRGQLKPGEQLPSERELADTMRVSRTSVRNALTQLITLGYLETRHGSGTYVVDYSKNAADNPFTSLISPSRSTIDEVLEYRVGIGMHGAALAAERATDADIQFLEETLHRNDGQTTSVQQETEADIAFHMGIAYATHNVVYIELTRRFYEYMFFRLKELHCILYEIQANLDAIEEQHNTILVAIKDGDPVAARRAMEQHIEFLRRLLRENSGSPSKVD